MENFFIELFKNTGSQIAALFGIFFVFGLPLSFLQNQTQRIYQRSVGWIGILWTAWIGTPVHELSHYFFAKIFRHKVSNVSLFSPNEETGELGHVNHFYDQRSVYQTIGNFFIGIAPMIGGSVVLIFLLYFLLPDGRSIFAPLSAYGHNSVPLYDSLKNTILSFFHSSHVKAWSFWLFLYLSFAVSSHLAPSPEDRKGMWKGFFVIIILLICLNIFALIFKTNIATFIFSLERYLGVVTALFLYALGISLFHYLLALLILGRIRR